MTESKATDKEREAFEAWAKTKKLLLERSGVWPDRYSYCQTDDAWDGWRAALSSRDEATADAADAKQARDGGTLFVRTSEHNYIAIASQRTSTEGKV